LEASPDGVSSRGRPRASSPMPHALLSWAAIAKTANALRYSHAAAIRSPARSSLQWHEHGNPARSGSCTRASTAANGCAQCAAESHDSLLRPQALGEVTRPLRRRKVIRPHRTTPSVPAQEANAHRHGAGWLLLSWPSAAAYAIRSSLRATQMRRAQCPSLECVARRDLWADRL
jgi:hypothetical protein